MDAAQLAEQIALAAHGRKGQNILTIDLRGRAAYTDFLVLASGTSDRHVQAVATHIEAELSRLGVRCLGREGLREGQWALIDYGAVVAHVFHAFTRNLYRLEQMWRSAPQQMLPGSEAAADEMALGPQDEADSAAPVADPLAGVGPS